MVDSHQSSRVTARVLIEIVLGDAFCGTGPARDRFGEKNPQDSVELGDIPVGIEGLAVRGLHAGFQKPFRSRMVSQGGDNRLTKKKAPEGAFFKRVAIRTRAARRHRTW